MSQGYLYVLSNPSFRANCLKIGLTKANPMLRAQELSRASGVPTPFHVEHAAAVRDVAIAEKRVHLLLSEHRVSRGKEFFSVDVETARRACECVVAFQEEDGGESDSFYLHDELVCATYTPDRSLNTRKLIYLLMAMTVGKNILESRVGVDRPHPVDGFVDASHVASYLAVDEAWARVLLRKLSASAPALLCQVRSGAIVTPVFDAFHCHRGHATWRFADRILSLFRNNKLSPAVVDRIDAIGIEAFFAAAATAEAPA